MRVVGPESACPILRSREWVKSGRIWSALRPLLGRGLITAEGADHVRQRAAIGDALRRIPQEAVVAAASQVSLALPLVGGVANLSDLALAAVEQVVRRVLFGAEVGEDVGPAIRGWLRLFPLRLLGLPVGGRHLKRLNRALAALPRPDWMPSDLRPEEVRDQLATLYVAAVETTASDVTWTLLGARDALPIWFVPRQHCDTGESAIVLLGKDSKFGAGPRKCLGEQLAGFVGEATCHLLTERASWEPHRLDLRPKLGLTRWPRRALVRRVA